MSGGSVGIVQLLSRVTPVSPLNLNDITATNTNLVVGVSPVPDNTVSLQEGSATRVGDKAFIEINLISDDNSRVEMTFGNSIVPAGGRILNLDTAANTINDDQINPQIDSDNSISFDVAGTTADVNMKISFWVNGYSDFEEYQLV